MTPEEIEARIAFLRDEIIKMQKEPVAAAANSLQKHFGQRPKEYRPGCIT